MSRGVHVAALHTFLLRAVPDWLSACGLPSEFKVEADIGKPQIAYRETITAPAHGDGKLVKQSGGRGDVYKRQVLRQGRDG